MKILMFGITPIISVFGVIACLLCWTIHLVSWDLPMLITAERLVVIFLPLNFDRVITPFRTWLVLVGVALYWLSIFICTSFWQVLRYEFDPGSNTSVGTITKSDFFNDNPGGVAAVEHTYIYSSMVIPTVFTVTGCVVIFVKLSIASSKRLKMTSKSRTSNRTTKTLLAVCAVYCLTAAVQSLPLYIPEYVSYSLTDASPTNFRKILYQLQCMTVCMNSSSNFLVYVFQNRKFRNTLKNILYRHVQS
ncbi:hypothetical protein Btru_072098 [Bulinus truncatus]|nr:hypothetical protein Btru_072098 [Bulinus truncatus]